MKLFDTHCHIHEIVAEAHDGRGSHGGGESMHSRWVKAGKGDADQVIAEALAVGVAGLICVGCTVEDSKLAIKFVQGRAGCWASVGIHPHEAKGSRPEKLAVLLGTSTAGPVVRFPHKNSLSTSAKELFVGDTPPNATPGSRFNKVVAIGECGLDYFYDHSPKKDQIKVLKFQIELALKHGLPLIFHVREAFDDFWPIFESYASAGRRVTGVLHSFTDSAKNMQKAVKHGLYIGVNGIATFTKDPDQLEVYKTIPLQNLLLETDAPFLTPKPLRGKVNAPANVSLVAEFLAALRGESANDLAEATTRNARQLFSI